MFYILHKRKLLPIDPDRIYTFCTRWTCRQKSRMETATC